MITGERIGSGEASKSYDCINDWSPLMSLHVDYWRNRQK